MRRLVASQLVVRAQRFRVGEEDMSTLKKIDWGQPGEREEALRRAVGRNRWARRTAVFTWTLAFMSGGTALLALLMTLLTALIAGEGADTSFFLAGSVVLMTVSSCLICVSAIAIVLRSKWSGRVSELITETREHESAEMRQALRQEWARWTGMPRRSGMFSYTAKG